MWQKLALVAAIGVLLGAQLLLTRGAPRGQSSADLREAAAKIDRLPLAFGPWHGVVEPLDAEDVAQGRLAGYTWRRYQNLLTGDVVSVLLVCGRAGPISVHTPDVCYNGLGYEVLQPPQRRTMDLPTLAYPAELWTARFSTPQAAAPSQLRICWAWSGGGTWEAPDNARLAYAGFPVLYKLYVVSEVLGDEDVWESDPCKRLLEQLLPKLQKTLSSNPRADKP